jgi:L-lactate dehydrogenase complex protein LldE
MSQSPRPPLRVGLFVTCLVDLYRPSIGFAAVKLLEHAGCLVEVPPTQTCCSQPAYNGGDKADAKVIARQVIKAFSGFDYVVAPSGSCAGMLRAHYRELFADEPDFLPEVTEFAERCYELVSFLTDVLGVERVAARYPGTVTYHDACSGLRELGIRAQPRQLLRSVAGLSLKELPGADVCCGFGGTFCIKYPDISERIASDKIAAATATGADTLLAGDLGCLLNMAGTASRHGKRLRVRHVAEVLADMSGDLPPIGWPEERA